MKFSDVVDSSDVINNLSYFSLYVERSTFLPFPRMFVVCTNFYDTSFLSSTFLFKYFSIFEILR